MSKPARPKATPPRGARARAKPRSSVRAARVVRPPRRKAARTAPRTRSGGRAARDCRTSCRLRLQPCARRPRAGRAGRTRSSSTATASRLGHGEVRLLTRKGLDWSEKFPNIAAAVARLPARAALLDGEIVVEDKKGISSFSELQAALKAGERERFVYYVFDLLHLDGRDLTALPLIERKAELARLVGKAQRSPIRYSEHFEDEGPAVLRHACELALEGIVSKRMDAPYRSGRSDTFIKTKCSNAQELVVGGYSPSTVRPRAIGALVVGYHDHGRLIYAGRVGTGYTQSLAQDLWKRLHPLEIGAPPFDQIPREEARRRDVRWVEP